MLAGETDAVTELMQRCEAEGIRARRIDVDYASHSAQVDAIREELIAALRGIEPRTSTVAFFSTVTGELMDTAGVNAEYWYRSIRQPVQFERAVRNAFDGGYRVFVESSPHPVLIAGIEETLVDCDRGATGEPIVIPTLGRDDGGVGRFWLSAGQAHVAGVGVDWRAAFADLGGRRVELPTYAFARQRFWLDGLGAVGGDLGGVGLVGAEHGLLAAVVQRPDSGGVVLTGRISVVAAPWLADHAVGPVVLFPGTGFVELALRAGDEGGLFGAAGVDVAGTVGAAGRWGAGPGGGGRRRAVGYSECVGVFGCRPGGFESGMDVARAGRVGGWLGAAAAELSVWPPVGARAMDVADGYQVLAARGYGYGPAFRGLQALWRRGAEVFADVTLPEGVPIRGFGIHPAVLDAALHAWGIVEGEQQTMLPFSWQGCVCTQAGLRGSVCDWRRWAGGGVGGVGRSAGVAGVVGAAVDGSSGLSGRVVEVDRRRPGIAGDDLDTGAVGGRRHWRRRRGVGAAASRRRAGRRGCAGSGVPGCARGVGGVAVVVG